MAADNDEVETTHETVFLTLSFGTQTEVHTVLGLVEQSDIYIENNSINYTACLNFSFG